MMRIRPLRLLQLLPLSLVLLAPAAGAQHSTVIYRCTDASGALTVQNDTPCPKGSRQDKRVIAPVQSMPSPQVYAPPAPRTPAPAPPPPMGVSSASTATGAPTGPSIADADRLPPPVLFECRTFDNDRYLSDDGAPPQRCAPVQTTGVGGSSTGAGSACQMVTDQCQRVADGALCQGWKQRLDQAESALRFGVGNREAAQAEAERLRRIVRDSTCGR